MADYDPNGFNYNSMQAALGLIPPFAASPPPMMFPGQVSAMMAQGGANAAMMGMGFPTQQVPTFTTGPGMLQGPGGVMMPMQSGAQNNPYSNQQGGTSGYGMPSIYSRTPAMPPPMYAGAQGSPVPFLSPPPPPSMFQTPYMGQTQQYQASQDRAFAGQMGMMGAAGRISADMLGAGVGYMAGGRMGAAVGFGASEFLGFGRAGQNMMGAAMAPAINTRGYGAGIEDMSRGFVSGGSYLGPAGQGFTHGASVQTARMLEDMSNSRGFQQETRGRFNTNDVMKITQLGADNQMMDGVKSPAGMVGRVKEIAKSVNAFMELANEPDIQRAIQTMGQMRQSGLGLSETLQAVQHGRTFARMAGTTFEQMSGIGGAQGSQTFQSMGLSQGLGYQVGMGNYGSARSAQNAGIHSNQMMNMLGGAQGYGAQNDMFSAGFLRMPMLAPGMMSANGGLSSGSMNQFLSGRSNMFGMTGQGAGTLGAMTGRHGVEGLGMALSMQPLLQDTIGRVLQAQGPFAQRQAEDGQILGMARQMGMRGSSGYITAGRAMGLSDTQAIARASELSSPEYFHNQRQQIEINRRERRSEELRHNEAMEPGMLDQVSSAFSGVASARRGLRGMSMGIGDVYETMTHGGRGSAYRPGSAQERREMQRFMRSSEFAAAGASMSHEASSVNSEGSFLDRFSEDMNINEGHTARGLLAGIASLRPRSRASREHFSGQMRQAGRLAAGIGNTGMNEEIRAIEGTTRGGINDATMNEFASNLAGVFAPTGRGAMMGANAAFRGGVSHLTRGLIDPGNITGDAAARPGQMRQAFISAATRNGQTEEQASSYWEQHQEQIMAAASTRTMSHLDEAGKARMRETIAQGQRASGSGAGSFIDTSRATAARGYTRLLGSEGSSQQNQASLRGFFSGHDSIGNTPAKQARSREYMAARQMALTVVNDASASPADKATANARLVELDNSVGQQFTPTELTQMRRQTNVRVHETQFENDHARVTALAFLHNASGADKTHKGSTNALDALHGGMSAIQAGSGMEAIAEGAASIGRGRGVLGHAFSGMTGQNFREGDLADRLTKMSDADVTALSRERGGADSAAMIRRFRAGGRGSQEALQQFQQQILAGRGEPGQQARDAHRNSSFWSRLVTPGQHAFETEQGAVNRATDRGTASDEDAARQLSEVDSNERNASGAGMGGAADALQSAARDLRVVAERFGGAADNGMVDSIIARNNS